MVATAAAQDRPPPQPQPAAPPVTIVIPAPTSAPAAPAAEPLPTSAPKPPPRKPTIGEVSVVVQGKPDAKPAPKAAPKPAARPAAKKAEARVAPSVSSPTVMLLKSGATRVQVVADRKVPVMEELAVPNQAIQAAVAGVAAAAGVSVAVPKKGPKLPTLAANAYRVTYRLKGAKAPGSTNRLPVPTTFLDTVVERVTLVDDGADVLVVIDLRESARPTLTELESERGAILQIDLPKPTPRAASAPAASAPAAPAAPLANAPKKR